MNTEDKNKYEFNQEVYFTSDGQEKVEVVKYKKYSNVTAKIIGTDYTITTSLSNIKKKE